MESTEVAELAKALSCVFLFAAAAGAVLALPRGITRAPERGWRACLPAGALGAEGMCRGHQGTWNRARRKQQSGSGALGERTNKELLLIICWALEGSHEIHEIIPLENTSCKYQMFLGLPGQDFLNLRGAQYLSSPQQEMFTWICLILLKHQALVFTARPAAHRNLNTSVTTGIIFHCHSWYQTFPHSIPMQ